MSLACAFSKLQLAMIALSNFSGLLILSSTLPFGSSRSLASADMVSHNFLPVLPYGIYGCAEDKSIDCHTLLSNSRGFQNILSHRARSLVA